MGHRSNFVQVPLPRHIHAHLPLGDKEDVLVCLHGPLQGGNGNTALHVKGQIHMGKNRQAPQGQNGNIHGNGFHGVLLSGEKEKGARGVPFSFL